MWFLLFQISLMLLLAAVLGAWAMWWWLSRRYRSLAQSRETLAAQVGKIEALATREDVSKEAGAVRALLEAQRPVDLQPLDERLQRLQSAVAGFRVPEPDLAPLHGRLAQIEARLADSGAGLAPIEQRLARLEEALRNIKLPEVDLAPVHRGLAGLGVAVSGMEAPLRGIEPMAGRIATLEARLGELASRIEGARRTDMDVIAARFATVTQAIANLRMPDLAPLQQRLTEVQAAVANIPPPNLQPVQAALSDLETFVVALDKPPPDLRPLQNRLASLETVLAAVQGEVQEARALQPIERRLASLEEALGSMPEPDLSPVIGAVRAIDSRHDLVAVENRLTAIEYGLAALHHMMRSRADGPEIRAAPTLHVVREAAPPAPLRPAREADPIAPFLRADDRANLLSEPAFGAPDDLEQIAGVGPMLRALLHDLGVYYFWQVAEWTPEEIDWVESKLMHFRGRIRRDDWVGKARVLAAAPTAAKRPTQGGVRRPI